MEVLLTERVVSLWMLTSLLEVLLATQYRRNVDDGTERSSPSYILKQSRILESEQRQQREFEKLGLTPEEIAESRQRVEEVIRKGKRPPR